MGETDAITLLLRDFAGGDKAALDRLIPLLYPELRKLARAYLGKERSEHTLQPTALIHEAYVRLVRQEQPDYRSRAHFMAIAAQVMRQVLIDHARRRRAGKRGAGAVNVPLDQAATVTLERTSEIIAVHDALTQLARMDPLKARLVEMRFFGGVTIEDCAEVLDITVAQVRRHLRAGQAWLQREVCRTVEG